MGLETSPREAPGARLRPGVGRALPSWLLPSLGYTHRARSQAGAEEAEQRAADWRSGGLVLGLALPLPKRAPGAGPTSLSAGCPLERPGEQPWPAALCAHTEAWLPSHLDSQVERSTVRVLAPHLRESPAPALDGRMGKISKRLHHPWRAWSPIRSMGNRYKLPLGLLF